MDDKLSLRTSRVKSLSRVQTNTDIGREIIEQVLVVVVAVMIMMMRRTIMVAVPAIAMQMSQKMISE